MEKWKFLQLLVIVMKAETERVEEDYLCKSGNRYIMKVVKETSVSFVSVQIQLLLSV